MHGNVAQAIPQPCDQAAKLKSTPLGARWFAAYTLSHHEKRVAALLSERQIESFVPLYATIHRWRNRCRKNLELPLFPNYVFVRMAGREQRQLLHVPGMLSLVSFGGDPAALPEEQIEALRSGMCERRMEPHPYLVVGERVRIVQGAMSGLEGVLVRKKNDLRIVLSLEALRQSVAVEVDAGDVEPVAEGLGFNALDRATRHANVLTQAFD
jgi:transcription antitermination factor NusG